MKMNILVCLNSKYIYPLQVMLYSLLTSNKNDLFDLYILHSSLSEEELKTVEKLTKLGNMTIHNIEMPDDTADNCPVVRHISKESYYRLFAPWYLPKKIDKILYLDPDTVVIGSVRGLYDTDLTDMCFAGASHGVFATHIYNKMRLNMHGKVKYINAGILLMNPSEIRKVSTQEKIKDYIKIKGKKLYFADQDVINGLYSEKIINTDPLKYNLEEFNLKVHNLMNFTGEKKDIHWVLKNSSIIHYCGKNKPWNDDYRGTLGIFFNKYSAKLKKLDFVIDSVKAIL